MGISLIVMGAGLTALACFACAGEPPWHGEDDWPSEREAMIREIRAHGFKDESVLRAMAVVRRHLFIPAPLRRRGSAYGDHPNPIGYDQTISQPYIVAYMTERIAVKKGDKLLEIGTGSGYQSAVLAQLGADVYTIEIVPELAAHARRALQDEGYGDVRVKCGDGYKGWPEHAPFDAIIVTCAPEDIPEALVTQLAEGGRMILPLGVGAQKIVILRKQDGKVTRENDIAVRFVPMVHGKE